ncbi:MAG: type II secretion system F family protein [Candidatus Omnitrophica bacterium]|nr:type II secretion system F family protein [Candidatus Omnitrophota bacterium]
MLELILIMVYLCAFSLILGIMPVDWESRPTLHLGLTEPDTKKRKRDSIFLLFRTLSKINKPFCSGAVRRRVSRDLAIAHVNLTPEEFFLVKELLGFVVLLVTFPSVSADFIFMWLCIGLVAGYMVPEFLLKGKIKKAKESIVKDLPDAIDLLALCVNAGLDFMLALKWVVEKSPPSIMIQELNVVLQEISVGKTRRDAIKDLALRYDLPDLSTFARTLIQADKMGTSVIDALNILSEDMRLARYRRGEQLALKAPIKMLVPLLIFIFPVVGILVAGPILLDFTQNNPFAGLAGG